MEESVKNTKSGTRWSAAEKKTLKKCVKEHVVLKDALTRTAEILGRSYDACYYVAWSLGLTITRKKSKGMKPVNKIKEIKHPNPTYAPRINGINRSNDLIVGKVLRHDSRFICAEIDGMIITITL